MTRLHFSEISGTGFCRDAHHFPVVLPLEAANFWNFVMNRTDELRTARIDGTVTPTEDFRAAVSNIVLRRQSRYRLPTPDKKRFLNGERSRLLVVIGPVRFDLECCHGIRDAARAFNAKSIRRVWRSSCAPILKTAPSWDGKTSISDPDLNGSYRVNYERTGASLAGG